MLQLLPLLQTALSEAAISVEKSVNFTTGNLSEDSVSVFVSRSLNLVKCLAVHDHSAFATLIGWGISHLHAEYKSSISTLLSLQGEKIQKFKVCVSSVMKCLTICPTVMLVAPRREFCVSCPPTSCFGFAYHFLLYVITSAGTMK